MSSRRTKQVGSSIMETLAEVLLREVSDPRLQNIVITDVQMSADLKVARVYFTKTSVEENWNEKESLQGFKQAHPFLKRMLGKRLALRSVPELRFERDTHGTELNRILNLIETEGAPRSSTEE